MDQDGVDLRSGHMRNNVGFEKRTILVRDLVTNAPATIARSKCKRERDHAQGRKKRQNLSRSTRRDVELTHRHSERFRSCDPVRYSHQIGSKSPTFAHNNDWLGGDEMPRGSCMSDAVNCLKLQVPTRPPHHPNEKKKISTRKETN